MENNIITKATLIAKTALTSGAIASIINTAIYLLASAIGFIPKNLTSTGVEVSISWINVLFGTFFSIVIIGGIGALIASLVFNAKAPTIIFVAAMLICLASFFTPFAYNLQNLTANETFSFVAVFNVLHAIAAYIAAPALANVSYTPVIAKK
jgi:hypothetical protein